MKWRQTSDCLEPNVDVLLHLRDSQPPLTALTVSDTMYMFQHNPGQFCLNNVQQMQSCVFILNTFSFVMEPSLSLLFLLLPTGFA